MADYRDGVPSRIRTKMCVASYDLKAAKPVNELVKKGGTSITNCFIRLGFDPECNDSSQDDIVCTPIQEFYMPFTGAWASAYKLKIGDQLLSRSGKAIPVTYIEFVAKLLQIYILEIEKFHTFFVGRYSTLTHNMVLPIAFNCALSIPLVVLQQVHLVDFLDRFLPYYAAQPGVAHLGEDWLGRKDSNLRMTGPKPVALPLGHAPIEN